jgi:hypothetical protein
LIEPTETNLLLQQKLSFAPTCLRWAKSQISPGKYDRHFDPKGSPVAKKRKRKYSKSSGSDVKNEMHRYKRGKAKSGPGGKGGKVKSRKQAIAIGLSKARKKGKKVPKKKS